MKLSGINCRVFLQLSTLQLCSVHNKQPGSGITANITCFFFNAIWKIDYSPPSPIVRDMMNFSDGDRRSCRILSCSGFMLGYVAFSVWTWIIYTGHHRSPDHPRASFWGGEPKGFVFMFGFWRAHQKCLVSFVSLWFSVSPNSLAGLGDAHRPLNVLYILFECVREGTE